MAPIYKIDSDIAEYSNNIASKNSFESVNEALNYKINSIDHATCEAGEEDPFIVADMSKIKEALSLWHEKLPQVHPFYAVKCNNDIEVLKYMVEQGVNFDCASKNEIEMMLNLGVSPDRIIYANPCKTSSYLRYSEAHDVNLTTVDNADELRKIKQYHPNCGILIRIATDDSNAQCQLSNKFGCTIDDAMNKLLVEAKELDLNIRGVAFHIGSGAKDTDPINVAIRDSRIIFDSAIELGFKNVNILDIGGGFEMDTWEESSKMVNYSLNKHFPRNFVDDLGIKFIAEPGRFMVANVFTLATHVIAKRDIPNNLEGIEAMLYINDGVYGNLNCIIFDHQHPEAKLFKTNNFNKDDDYIDEKGQYSHYYSIWGPTCDGLDCVSTKAGFNNQILVGDWIYFPNIGAYSSVASTCFNGFLNSSEVIYINN